MNRVEQSIYLELLRASLWERTINLSVFTGEWSWQTILDAFINHDQLGVVANTIALLPQDILNHSCVSGTLPTGEGGERGPLSVVYQYIGSLIKSHHLLNTRIRDIMPRLESAGCHPVLLKGQGLSTLYPKTCFRSCGDLDIYVGAENMDKAKAIVNAMATKEEVEQAEDSSHHYHIDLEGVTYEIHRYSGDAGNKKYQDAYVALSTPCLQPEQCEQVTLTIGDDNIHVRVPSIDFNVWYIFNHIVTHLVGGGVGYRQFSDWLIVLRQWNKRNQYPCQSEKSVGIKNLESILRQTGLFRAWQILGGILVYQLGFQSEEFPLWDEHMARKSQGFIKREIIGGHSFRLSSMECIGQQGHGLKHIKYNIRFYYYNSRPLYLFSPWAPYKSMWNWLTGGLTHALTGSRA